jgi:hypothetical protein
MVTVTQVHRCAYSGSFPTRGYRDALDTTLGAWAEALVIGTAVPQDAIAGLASGGKTLRGRKKHGAPLLSALAHRVGLPLAHEAVVDKTNEMPVALELLRQVVLAGRVVTMEA